jgi:hypothetical protein
LWHVDKTFRPSRSHRAFPGLKIAAAVGLVLFGVLLEAATTVVPAPLIGQTSRTIQVNGITIVQAQTVSRPSSHMSQDDAVKIALSRFNSIEQGRTGQGPSIKGASMDLAFYSPGVLRAEDPHGSGFITAGSPINAWVIGITAPPQNGFNHIVGFVVVNADNGRVEGYSVTSSN